MRAFSLSFCMSLGLCIKLLGTAKMDADYTHIQSFVDATRDVVYLRKVDNIMIIRPNKIQHVNDTAFEMLYLLYNKSYRIDDVVRKMHNKYNEPEKRLANDLVSLVAGIKAIMNDNYGCCDMIETIPFEPASIKYPVLSEIALTYRCQNNCDFCYASSPYRGDPDNEMTTRQVKQVIKKIYTQAHVPTISFTGGEPTLRDDLPELVRFADQIGLRTNLITNGIVCADEAFVRELARSGLKSAQVSLESHEAEIHNAIVGNNTAFPRVVKAVHNLKDAGIFTHTNTTICAKNRDLLIPLVDFIKKEFNNDFLSMNMIIATGIARDNDNIKINYSTIGSILKPVLRHCEMNGIKFVWYSPTPYCLFNPVDNDLGSKSCACVSGLLSVNPYGEVLPCSSYDKGIGNLVKRSFLSIWNSDQAYYYREKKYRPPVCNGCEFEVLCGGACPLYWEHAGSFAEIEKKQDRRPVMRNLFWNIEHMLRVRSKGVKGQKEGGRL